MPNVPTITPGPDDTECTPEGATETIPLITNVHADKQSERTNDTAEISDEEAYAKLKAKRAERRHKKLIRRGIVAGVVGAIALIAIVATLVINAQPQGASGAVTDMVTEGTFSTTVSLKATLRGYQVDGYQWLGSLEHLSLGGILADDMGLGKTLQMIAHILARVEAGDTKPTLVVCPASLVYNWTAELERFAPSLDVCAIVGTKAQRRVQIAGVAEHNVVVTSYDLMRRDIDE